MVFFVEGDKSTTLADLNGTGTSTQGNYVSGTPYPIFNPVDPQCSQLMSDYKIQGFPTIYMICPDKKIYEIGQASESQILAKVLDSCAMFNLDATTTALQTNTYCTTTFSPIVTLRNGGSTALTSCKLTYKIDNGSPLTFNWTGNLASKTATNVTLPSLTTALGDHTFTVESSSPNGGTDQFTANDSKTYNFLVNTTTGNALPFSEGFAGNVPASGWLINNMDGDITWAKNTSVGGSGASSSCIFYDAYNYGNKGATDEFQLPPHNFTGITTPILDFNVAYAPYDATYYETLEVLVSKDCSQTWTSVYNKSGTGLGTVPAATAVFTPTASQWRKEIIDLSAYSGQSSVYVKFKVTNGYGNQLYIDDINLKTNIGVKDNMIDYSLYLFPNPAQEIINLSFTANSSGQMQLSIFNGLGALLKTEAFGINAGQQTISVPVNDLPKGLYHIEPLASGKFRI